MPTCLLHPQPLVGSHLRVYYLHDKRRCYPLHAEGSLSCHACGELRAGTQKNETETSLFSTSCPMDQLTPTGIIASEQGDTQTYVADA